MKWSYYNKENILYVGFTNGTILSYTISNTFQYVKLSSRLSLGSPVRFVCLFIFFFLLQPIMIVTYCYLFLKM